MKAPLPAEEHDRLCVLRELAVLDSPPEPGFDDLVALAAHACDAPTGLISLVDVERQWFKAVIGLDVRETHRDLSFCAHAILDRKVLVVPDATADARFADNDLVVGPPHIRFYAGAPLIGPRGQALGALAVIDYRPRSLEPKCVDLLERLARQAVAQLELRRHIEHSHSERRRIEQDAARVLELTRELVCTLGRDGDVRQVNPAVVQALGCPAEELIGRPFLDLVAPADRDRAQVCLERLQAGEAVPTFELHLQSRAPDGVLVEFLATALRQPGEVGEILVFGRDVTERRHLQVQLQQAQRMEAIGRLAGGVAHDFNNILAAILMQSSLLELTARPSPAIRDGLRQIQLAAERAAGLTRQLLTFSRRQQVQLRVVNLAEVVDGLIKMLSRILGEDIALDVHAAGELPAIKVDVSMLEQVIMNLVVNARDAMPRGGRLTISMFTDRPASPEGEEGWVVLAVGDTGHGIAPDILPRIFEPFFTTKEVGKGTGLGLATVYGIVQEHGGRVDVRSGPEQGAIFEVRFPIAREPLEAPAAEPLAAPRPGSETVLLVEDETRVRELTRLALEQAGYRVIDADSGVAALRAWQHHRASIQLLLVDMVMPGMNGRECVAALDQPDFPVIYMSGYSPDEVAPELRLEEGRNFLRKPFGPDRLLHVVRHALDRAQL